MSADKLDAVITRLESLATKLESVCARGGSAGSAPSSAIVEEFEPILKGPVAEFTDVSSKISNDVKEAALLICKAFNSNYELMKVVAASKKPSPDAMKNIMKPLSDSIEEIKNFASKNFKSEFKPHLEALAAFASCFAWVQSPGKPQAFITDSIDSGVFYSNRVLSGFKDKGENHKIFTQKLRICFEKLKEYTQEFHPMGCSWNPSGVEAQAPAAVTSVSAPPPAPKTTSCAPSKPAPDSGALFAALNAGSSVTSKLKKVDDSQKTHKNPNLRVTAVVKDTGSKTSTSKATAKPETVKPPKFSLAGRKWEIENQIDQQQIEVKEGDNRYCAYIYNCKTSNIIIEPKLNIVSLDKCNNCSVLLKAGSIAGIEITNCKKIQIQSDDLLPTATVNSCDSIDIFLNNKSKDFKVSTNNSSAVNFGFKEENTELEVFSVPVVFESFIKDGKLVTQSMDI